MSAAGLKVESSDGSTFLEGTRELTFGFFLGQGGEKLRVEVRASGPGAEATLRSEKQAVGFLTQVYRNDRVAGFIDRFLSENARLRRGAAEPKGDTK
jgi:hypothetical protein